MKLYLTQSMIDEIQKINVKQTTDEFNAWVDRFVVIVDLFEDTAELDEDVSNHCLGYWQTHDDGRVCGYHHRLDKWIFSKENKECLREHVKPDWMK